MAKIERKYMAHYVNTATGSAETAAYTRLGKDLEEYSAEMSDVYKRQRSCSIQTSWRMKKAAS